MSFDLGSREGKKSPPDSSTRELTTHDSRLTTARAGPHLPRRHRLELSPPPRESGAAGRLCRREGERVRAWRDRRGPAPRGPGGRTFRRGGDRRGGSAAACRGSRRDPPALACRAGRPGAATRLRADADPLRPRSGSSRRRRIRGGLAASADPARARHGDGALRDSAGGSGFLHHHPQGRRAALARRDLRQPLGCGRSCLARNEPPGRFDGSVPGPFARGGCESGPGARGELRRNPGPPGLVARCREAGARPLRSGALGIDRGAGPDAGDDAGDQRHRRPPRSRGHAAGVRRALRDRARDDGRGAADRLS